MTICLWVHIPEHASKWRAIATNGKSGIQSRGDFVWAVGGEKMHYVYWSGDDAAEQSESAPRPSAGRWYHLAIVVDSDEDTVVQFIDGTPAAEDRQFAKDLDVSKPLIHVGRFSHLGIIGRVDDVMMYGRPLSAYEINRIYILQGGRR